VKALEIHNEQRMLEQSVRTLHAYLAHNFAIPFQITIADNASSDATLDLARGLADELDDVEVMYLDRKGRGHALRVAWMRSDADVLAYMDVDLSTDLSALGELLTPLLERGGDIAIGARFAPGAQVSRRLKRELISRPYNLLFEMLLGAAFSDAQCGFKAGRREVIQALLDDVEDEAWFFDTELLFLAQRRKLAIHEVPLGWIEDPTRACTSSRPRARTCTASCACAVPSVGARGPRLSSRERRRPVAAGGPRRHCSAQ
jgi:glycosyltransferase involved in cell wall biosynthesis